MTLTAVILLVISAFFHATWNMIGKRDNPSQSFFLAASVFGCLCLSPVAFMHLPVISQIPRDVWMLLFVTGFFQALYYSGLAGAYRHGHLSVAYPLARSAPVLIVAGVNLLIGRGDELSTQSIVGMVIIAVGALVLPVEKPSEWKLRNYVHISTLFALMAAVGTAGYSIVDDSALRILRDGVSSVSRTTVTLIYALMEWLSATAWMVIFMVASPGKSGLMQGFSRKNVSSSAIGGIGICVAYSLVLLAMASVTNVSYVVAFRQLGIPIGATLGVLVLKEPRYAGKAIGIAVMLVGLILVGTG